MKKVRIGFVGYGTWGQNLARVIYENPEIDFKWIVEKNEDRFYQAKRKFGHDVITRLDISEVDCENLDGVVIATPPATHAEIAKYFLTKGVNVFVEKPLTLQLDQARELIRLARNEELILMVGHLMLFHPAILKMKEMVVTNKLGSIMYVYSSRISTGKLVDRENALWDLAPHDLSILSYILDDIPMEVNALGIGEPEEVTFINARYHDNIIANIHVGWDGPYKKREMTLVGAKGVLIFDDMDPYTKLKFYPRNVHSYEVIGLPGEEPLKKEINSFVDRIRSKKVFLLTSKNNKYIATGEEGYSILKILSAAQQSIDWDGAQVPVNGQIDD